VRGETSSPTRGAGYAAGTVTKPPNWHGLVAWDLLLNNLATGLFLVAALGELAAPAVFHPVARVAYPIALVLLLADLVCLVLDLGDPLRFHHMLRVFKPSSPMSLGTWSLTLYSLALTVIVAIDLLQWISPGPRGWAVLNGVRWLAVLGGLPFALGSAIYKGVLFSTSSQPAWKDARWLGGYLTNAAVMLGCAELLVLALLIGQARAAAILRPALMLLLALNLIPLGLLLGEVRPAIQAIDARMNLIGTGVLALGVGTLIPFCLLLVGGGRLLMVGAAILIFLGNLMIRGLIVKVPHLPAVQQPEGAGTMVPGG
jgi:hypothetical protein